MKFTLSWLRDHLHTDATLDRITTTLSAIGLEVESVEDRASSLAPFVTARVIEAVQHPNADRLRVCRVDIGTGEEIQVVCGAPNARTGMGAVFAPPGAIVPGTGTVLKVGEIRGVKSAGMLVSARELGLGNDHDGIIEIPTETMPGQSYASWAQLDDPVVEIGVTPNRGDALAVRGIARDLAAAGLGVLKPWTPAHVDGGFNPVVWKNDYREGCPWVVGRSVLNVRNGPSPDWLVRRLTAIGLRPISTLVDITNFFTYDLGRPLHVFDVDRISGGTLTVRRGVSGEMFTGLDGQRYGIVDGDIVIADATGVVSLGGIMGGASTGVNEHTRNVFIECALFDSIRIAQTGRRLQLHTDARARFERGVDNALLPRALDAATRMIMDLSGGEPTASVQAGAEPAWRRRATLRFERIAGLGGADIAPGDAVSTLEALGFPVQTRTETEVTVAVPPWRNDVAGLSLLDTGGHIDADREFVVAEGAAMIEAECDLLEEVLRIRGLDHVPPVSLPPPGAVPAPALSAAQIRASRASRVLASRGLAECVTFSFMDRGTAVQFGGGAPGLRLMNPISADLDQMRPTPLATLVQAAIRNAARDMRDGALFEVGPAYTEDGEAQIAAGLRTGNTPRHWQAPSRAVTSMDAKADLWAVLLALAVPMDALTVTPDAPAWYHPGRSGVVRQGPKTMLAYFGELHPGLQAELGLEGAASGFELFMAAIPEPRRRRRAPLELSPFQPVRRDFAFLAPETLSAETVLRAVRGADRTMITRVSLFDVYAGDKLEPGQVSLGLEVVLQPREKTLTEAEIEAVSAKIVAAAKKVGAQLR